MLHLHTSQLLADYGYYAVFFAGLLEGETMLLLGAYAVHQGYLQMAPLIACGAAAAFLTDQFYFHLGRRRGRSLPQRHPALAARFDRAAGFAGRHPVPTVLLMRFAWGLRIVLPVALGMTTLRTAVYMPLSALAAVVWASVVAFAGVWITGMLRMLLGHLHRHEWWFIGIALAVALVVAARRLRMA